MIIPPKNVIYGVDVLGRAMYNRDGSEKVTSGNLGIFTIAERKQQMSVTLSFPVQSFRHIPAPNSGADNTTGANMYVAICDVKNLPESIPMDTNPREQNLNTNVAKKIKNSLLDTSSADFYLLNRGLLLSAKKVSFNNYSNVLTIVFEDPEVHGDVDGGHTYNIILKNRDILEVGQQYVKLEILTGIEEIFQRLAAARNISVPIQDKSIAELENRFELIKGALLEEPFLSRVYFEENGEGDIDVADLLSILMMFNLDRYPGMDSFPTISYSGKKRCIDLYIQDHKQFALTTNNPYVKMIPIMPDIFKLYDKIEANMKNYYTKKNSNGHYGSTKGVIVPKDRQTVDSKFYQTKMEVESPNGFIYPILGAFRALLKKEGDHYAWKANPFDILDITGPDLVESTVSMSRALGNNPQSTGKDVNLWKTLYMTVAFAAIN